MASVIPNIDSFGNGILKRALLGKKNHVFVPHTFQHPAMQIVKLFSSLIADKAAKFSVSFQF